jgi:GT2 family glycosyltransferase
MALSVYSPEAIQILDDDTIPSTDHLEILFNTLIESADTIGVSGVTTPLWKPLNPKSWKTKVLRISALYSVRGGSVTSAGVAVPHVAVGSEVLESDWLYGCSMWRASLFSRERYLDQLVGSALFEDVEFSIRAHRHGRLLVNTAARLQHLEAPEGRPDSFLYSYRFTRNRLLVVKNLESSSKWFTYSLSIAVILISQVIAGREGRRAVVGTLLGLLDELRCRPLR